MSVDPVGGESFAAVLSKIHYNGSVAVSGLTRGGNVRTTVFTFILRGINLLGIDSVNCPMDVRKELWKRMFKEKLPESLPTILKGQASGRIVVKIGS